MASITFFQRWHLLTRATRKLEGCRSLTDVLETLREHARVIAAADGVAVVRREGNEVAYVGEDAIAPLWTGRRFAIETCVSGMAILQREPVFIPDILADDRVPLNAYLSTFVRSMAVFPVGASAPIAALGCYWARAQPIHDDAARLIGMLTMSANMAIERMGLSQDA